MPSCLGRIFLIKEKTQVLNAITSIWENFVSLTLINDWCVKINWSDWPGRVIFSVPEDRKENAAAWNVRKIHEHNDTCVISKRPKSRKKKLSFKPRRLHRYSMVFFKHAGSVKKWIVFFKDPFDFSAQFLWSTNLRILRGLNHYSVAISSISTPI